MFYVFINIYVLNYIFVTICYNIIHTFIYFIISTLLKVVYSGNITLNKPQFEKIEMMFVKSLNKKGFQITEVPSLVVVLLVIAIVLSVGATILGQVQDTQSTGTLEYNITQEGLEGQRDLSEWQGTWVVIIAAAVVIGIVGRYLFFG